MAKLHVEVTPKSRRPGVVALRGEVLKVRVAAPPEGGRANQELLRLLADFFGVPRSGITLVRGAAARRKLLEIEGLTPDAREAALRRVSPAGEGR